MEKYYKLVSKSNESNYGEIANFIYEEKKSKFITYIFEIENKESAISKIELLRKSFFDAKHVVYLYSYLENNTLNVKFSDDGEPQGTGTKLILEMLNKEKISNVCIVIIRYFGGMLLGAGSLSRAYLNSFKSAFNSTYKANIINYVPYEFITDYSKYNEINNYILEMVDNQNIIVFKKEFNDKVYMKLKINELNLDEFKLKVEGS